MTSSHDKRHAYPLGVQGLWRNLATRLGRLLDHG
jgi:hypothetical protein